MITITYVVYSIYTHTKCVLCCIKNYDNRLNRFDIKNNFDIMKNIYDLTYVL